MVDAVGLSIRHKRFADEWIISQNASESARQAGFTGKNVGITAARLLKKPKIADYIKARLLEIQSKIEVKQEDIRQYWAELMKDESANHADRLRASEYLAKEKGMFKETPSFVAMFSGVEVKQMAQAVDMSKCSLISKPEDAKEESKPGIIEDKTSNGNELST